MLLFAIIKYIGSNPSGGMRIYIFKYIEQFKMQNAKVVLLKTSIRTSLPLYTSERAFLSIRSRRKALSLLLNPKSNG